MSVFSKAGEYRHGVVIDRYQFPLQDTEFDDQDDAFEPGSEKPSPVASVEAIDLEHQTIDLRKGVARAEHHPSSLFTHDKVSNPDAVGALLRLGEFVRDNGIDGPGHHRAARDLLLWRNPRLAPGAILRIAGESTVASARRAVLALDGGVLAIQGPPGAGKTFTGARMIVDLVRAGKKVGVTAGSHKVIRNLLEEVVRAIVDEKLRVRCMHRVSEKSRTAPTGIDEETDSAKAVGKIQSREYDVVGGTAWVWWKEDLARSIDRPGRRRGGPDVARQRARVRAIRHEFRAPWGSAAARATAESKSSRGIRAFRSGISARRP